MPSVRAASQARPKPTLAKPAATTASLAPSALAARRSVCPATATSTRMAPRQSASSAQLATATMAARRRSSPAASVGLGSTAPRVGNPAKAVHFTRRPVDQGPLPAVSVTFAVQGKDPASQTGPVNPVATRVSAAASSLASSVSGAPSRLARHQPTAAPSVNGARRAVCRMEPPRASVWPAMPPRCRLVPRSLAPSAGLARCPTKTRAPATRLPLPPPAFP